MKLYVYGGSTASEALKIAQSKHGEDALVVKTRELRKRSFNRPGRYEIIVAVEENENSAPDPEESDFEDENHFELAPEELVYERKSPEKKSLNKSLAKQRVFDATEDFEPDFSDKSKDFRRPVSDFQDLAPQKLQNDGLKSIKDELNRLADKINLIQNMFWEEKSPKNLQIPKEFAQIYKIITDAGMDAPHVDEIMRLNLELMPPAMRANSTNVRRYFRELLRKMIHCRDENFSVDPKKRWIFMLVGPTGVGKTTTLAKLAARFSRFLPEKRKVGIITLDTYRIGALEQLTWYARKMKIPLEMATDPENFARELDAMRYCDVVLIDSAGYSQHDDAKIRALQEFSRDFADIQTMLCLSATTKYDDLRDIYESFGALKIDSFIFTKLDECRGVGNIFSLAYETKRPVSYVSLGQEVPMDLLVANGEFLCDCVMNGFKATVAALKNEK